MTLPLCAFYRCPVLLVGCVVSLLTFWIGASDAVAHPEGFSGLHVSISSDSMRAAITLHTRDLDAWFPPGKHPDYVTSVIGEMEATVDEIVELQFDGRPLTIRRVEAFLLEVGLIEIDVDYDLPPADDTVELLVWSKHLILMPRGHQQLLFVEDRRDLQADAEHGLMRLEDVLTVERDAGAVMLPTQSAMAAPDVMPSDPLEDQERSEVETNREFRQPRSLPASEASTSRISFFLFGVEHILTGYDHLLFLAALLLTCTTFGEAATIVTCFTIAHSITLALAALDLVRLPGEIVEPAIALSIVYVAVENLVTTPSLRRRAAITGCFGLIHGLGFASALREIGLGSIPGGVIWPLFKFNLGVESGQLLVASVILPLMFIVRRNEQYAGQLVRAGSILVALTGGYWFVTRVLSQFLTG